MLRNMSRKNERSNGVGLGVLGVSRSPPADLDAATEGEADNTNKRAKIDGLEAEVKKSAGERHEDDDKGDMGEAKTSSDLALSPSHTMPMMYPPHPGYLHHMYQYPPAYGYPPFMPPAFPKGAESDEKKHVDENGDEHGDSSDAKASGDTTSPSHMPYPLPPFPPGMIPSAMIPPFMMPAYGQGLPFGPPFSPSAMFMMQFPMPPSQGTPLHLKVDLDSLSDYQCLVRQQLELFEAGHEDVEGNTQGRKKPIAMDQVSLNIAVWAFRLDLPSNYYKSYRYARLV
jgi:hypothetical protein